MVQHITVLLTIGLWAHLNSRWDPLHILQDRTSKVIKPIRRLLLQPIMRWTWFFKKIGQGASRFAGSCGVVRVAAQTAYSRRAQLACVKTRPAVRELILGSRRSILVSWERATLEKRPLTVGYVSCWHWIQWVDIEAGLTHGDHYSLTSPIRPSWGLQPDLIPRLGDWWWFRAQGHRVIRFLSYIDYLWINLGNIHIKWKLNASAIKWYRLYYHL